MLIWCRSVVMFIFIVTYIITSMARNGLLCADVQLRNYSLTVQIFVVGGRPRPVFKELKMAFIQSFLVAFLTTWHFLFFFLYWIRYCCWIIYCERKFVNSLKFNWQHCCCCFYYRWVFRGRSSTDVSAVIWKSVCKWRIDIQGIWGILWGAEHEYGQW